jgi:hypothetical protein
MTKSFASKERETRGQVPFPGAFLTGAAFPGIEPLSCRPPPFARHRNEAVAQFRPIRMRGQSNPILWQTLPGEASGPLSWPGFGRLTKSPAEAGL